VNPYELRQKCIQEKLDQLLYIPVALILNIQGSNSILILLLREMLIIA